MFHLRPIQIDIILFQNENVSLVPGPVSDVYSQSSYQLKVCITRAVLEFRGS